MVGNQNSFQFYTIYTYEFYNNDTLLLDGNINVFNNSTENILIDINNVSQNEYNFIIYPQNNIDKIPKIKIPPKIISVFAAGNSPFAPYINVLHLFGLLREPPNPIPVLPPRNSSHTIRGSPQQHSHSATASALWLKRKWLKGVLLGKWDGPASNHILATGDGLWLSLIHI